MQTYDRLVVYGSMPAADAYGSQPRRTHASSSPERHLRSSQERSSHERSQQLPSSSREPMEPGTTHARNRSVGERAQPEPSTARENQSPQGHVEPDVNTRGEQFHRTSQKDLGETELDLAPKRKRRRFSAAQPPAEVDDQSRPRDESCRPGRSQEGDDGAHCSSEGSRQPAWSSMAVGCNGNMFSMAPSSRTEEVQPHRTDEAQHSSTYASKLSSQSVPRHSAQWRSGSRRPSEASSTVLAELRVQALAAVRAHRDRS